jgi:hypothetical protein
MQAASELPELQCLAMFFNMRSFRQQVAWKQVGLNRLEQEAIEAMNALLMAMETKLATCKQAFGSNERLLNASLRHYSHRLHKQVLQTQFSDVKNTIIVFPDISNVM